jgi:hypothetical protein
MSLFIPEVGSARLQIAEKARAFRVTAKAGADGQVGSRVHRFCPGQGGGSNGAVETAET